MSLSTLRDKMKTAEKNAEVIFDREEPVGRPTDLVLPDRRWFRRWRKAAPAMVRRAPNK